MIKSTVNEQIIDRTLPEHLRVLERAVDDIISNNRRDVFYVETTLYFLRYVANRLYLQQASSELRNRSIRLRARLEEYQSHHIPLELADRHQDTLAPVITHDARLRYLMAQLGLISQSETSETDLEQKDWEAILSVQRKAREKKTEPVAKQYKLPALSTSNPALLAVGRKLEVDLSQPGPVK